MDLTDMVEKVLKEYPKSRDSDQWLTLKIWALFYKSRVHEEILPSPNDSYSKIRKYVYLEDIMELPREDTIKRIRAVFQNIKKMYLPTNIEVVRRRKQNEKVWREITNSEYIRL